MHIPLRSLCLILLFSHSLMAQNDDFLQNKGGTISLPHQQTEPSCGFQPTRQQIQEVENNPAYQQARQNFLQNYNNRALQPINYVPIKAHIVRTSSGTGGLTVAQLNAAITNMNNFYVNANMQFYLCGGINYIDNSTYYNFDASEETALHSAHGATDLINIYFCDNVTSGASNLCGYAYFPGGPDLIMMKNSCAVNGSTLPHEMGHFFALYHTHGTTNGTLTDELVNGSNCTSSGDRVCDTPADPQLGNSNVNSSCVYDGTAPYTGGVAVDANNDPFVPDPNNIMSYSRKSCRTLFSPGQYARIYAAYSTLRNYFTCPSFDVNFGASPRVSCSTPTTVTFSDSSAGATSWAWDVDGDNVVDYTTQNCTHNYTTAGTYDVRLTISNGTDTIVRTKTEHIHIGANYSVPYAEDFETFIGNSNASGLENGWETTPTNTTSQYRWNPYLGNTPSSNTGPTVDNTLGTSSGMYMYTEASNGSSGDAAELLTPCIDLTSPGGVPLLDFAYHMHGSNMGQLRVDIFAGGTWTNDITTVIFGEQQTTQTAAYLNRQVSLSAYQGQVVRLRFRGLRGNGFRSDIAIDDVNISNGPCNLTASVASQSNLDCNGDNDGQVTFSASNGTPSYSYDIGSGAQAGGLFTGLTAGSYTVTVTDVQGCTANASVTLTEPNTLSASTNSTTMVACNGGNSGAAAINANGGTGSYSYDIGNGSQANGNFNTLTAGNYIATVTDANGCEATTTVSITEPTPISLLGQVQSNYNGADVSCTGATDGSADVTSTGGTPSYTYLWSNGATVASIAGLGQGTYTVTVTDNAGCSSNTSVVINDPVQLAATHTATNVQCNGAVDGQIVVNATAGTGTLGTGNYEYRLTGPGQSAGYSTNNTFNSLDEGAYVAYIQDANNCEITINVTITEPDSVIIDSVATTDVVCNGTSTGTAVAYLSGGVGNYSYNWSHDNAQTSQTAIGLSDGSFTVTATDGNGCAYVETFIINEPTAVVAATNTPTIACNGGVTSATATASGGTPLSGNYLYDWSNGTNSATANNLTAGAYCVTATDNNGCTDVACLTITEPSVLMSTITDNGDGTATASGSGGTPPFSYQWDASANAQTTATATGLINNTTYTVTVTDGNGCTSTTNVTVIISGIEDIVGVQAFDVMPNPTTGRFEVKLQFNQVQKATVQITNVLGQTIHNQTFTAAAQTIPVDLQQQASGVYFVTLRMDGKAISRKVTVRK